jgi:hypothetical protein
MNQSMIDKSIRLPNRHRASQFRRTNRTGMASLEFVMGLPFLLMMMAIIYAVAYAGVHKTKVVFQARHQVWTMREDSHSHSLERYKRITDTKPMRLLSGVSENDMPGEVSGIGSSSWTTYSWLGGNKTTKSSTVIITGTWDHKEITDFNSSGPHFSVLERIAGIENLPLLDVIDQIISFVL